MTPAEASAPEGSKPPSASSIRGHDSRCGRSGGPRRVHSGQRRSSPRRHAPSESEARPRSRRVRQIALIMLLQKLDQGHVSPWSHGPVALPSLDLGHRGSARSAVEARNSSINRRPRWPPRLHRQHGGNLHHVLGHSLSKVQDGQRSGGEGGTRTPDPAIMSRVL